MIDIETLDTKTSAVVLSIGVAMFDEKKIHHSEHIRVNVQEQIDRGRTISESTLAWWMMQSDEARAAVFGEEAGVIYDTPEARDRLGDLWLEWGPKVVWSKGPHFDIAKLEDLFGGNVPWEYHHPRDTRTRYELYQQLLGKDPEKIRPSNGMAHNAEQDAIHQALEVMWIMQNLREHIA